VLYTHRAKKYLSMLKAIMPSRKQCGGSLASDAVMNGHTDASIYARLINALPPAPAPAPVAAPAAQAAQQGGAKRKPKASKPAAKKPVSKPRAATKKSKAKRS
jgi:hypothetical protein